MKHFIYIHKKKTNNEIFYVGQGCVKNRNKSKHNRNNFWHNIVNKHGFVDEVISENLSKVQANNLERFLISKIGRFDLGRGPLANMTDGGDGLYNPSEITKKKMRENHADVRGHLNPMFGKTFNHTDEAKEKIRIAGTGRKHKPETIAKMTGIRNPMFGKTFNHTDETKEKIRIAFKNKKYSIIECPYCNKRGGGNAMYRWHFDNCKNK